MPEKKIPENEISASIFFSNKPPLFPPGFERSEDCSPPCNITTNDGSLVVVFFFCYVDKKPLPILKMFLSAPGKAFVPQRWVCIKMGSVLQLIHYLAKKREKSKFGFFLTKKKIDT